MTKEEAKQAITERLKLYGENTMEVDLYGRSFPLYTTNYDPDHVQLVDIFGKPMDPSEATEATQDPSESSESSEAAGVSGPAHDLPGGCKRRAGCGCRGERRLQVRPQIHSLLLTAEGQDALRAP